MENKVEAAAAASEENTIVSHDQDAPKEPTATSSPDTDSPVMINVDVSVRIFVYPPIYPPNFCYYFT